MLRSLPDATLVGETIGRAFAQATAGGRSVAPHATAAPTHTDHAMVGAAG
jgi:hypothetical protein